MCPYRSWSSRGWPIFSMLSVLFSRWVFIHLSLHKRMVGNMDAQSHNEIKINNNKIPWKVLVWRAPVDTAGHGLWKNGGKEINFIFCLGTAYDVSSMENIGNSRSFSLTRKACLSKYFYLFNFSFELWHIWQISTSLYEGPSYLLLCNFYFLFESPSSLIKHQLETTIVILVHWM